MTKISVVVPLFNEEGCVKAFWKRLKQVLGETPFEFEVILVDDASQDQTWQRVRQIQQEDSRVKGISLSQHAGHQIAFFSGLGLASGEAVITLDGDLQHPPEKIPLLIKEWQNGFDLVYGFKTSQAGRGFVKKKMNHLFHRLLSLRSGVPFHPETSDFQILDRKVAQRVLATWHPPVFLRGWIHRQATHRYQIPFQADRRYDGKSRQNPFYLLGIGIQTLLSPSVHKSSNLHPLYEVREKVGF